MADQTGAFDIDPTSNLGPDSTATFDDGPSNPTEHASSEALDFATEDNGEPADAIDEDDETGVDDDLIESDDEADEDDILGAEDEDDEDVSDETATV